MFNFYVERFSILRLISYSLSILLLGFLIKNTCFMSVYLSFMTTLFTEPAGLHFSNYLIDKLLLEMIIFNSNKVEYLLKFVFTWITIILVRGCLIDICLVLDSIFLNSWLDYKYLATEVLNQTLLKAIFPLFTEIPIFYLFLNNSFFISLISNILTFFEEIWTFDLHYINTNIVYEDLNINKFEINDIKIYNNITERLVEQKTYHGTIEKLKNFLKWPNKPISSQSCLTWKQLNEKHLMDIDSRKLLPKINIPTNYKPPVNPISFNMYNLIISKLPLDTSVKILETKLFIIVENSSKNFIWEVTPYDINYKDNLILKGKLDKPIFEEAIPQIDTNIYVFMADMPDKGKGKAIYTENLNLAEENSEIESTYDLDMQNAMNYSRAHFRSTQQVGESSSQGAWRNNDTTNMTDIATAALNYQPNISEPYNPSSITGATELVPNNPLETRVRQLDSIQPRRGPRSDSWIPSPSVDSFDSPPKTPSLDSDPGVKRRPPVVFGLPNQPVMSRGVKPSTINDIENQPFITIRSPVNEPPVNQPPIIPQPQYQPQSQQQYQPPLIYQPPLLPQPPIIDQPRYQLPVIYEHEPRYQPPIIHQPRYLVPQPPVIPQPQPQPQYPPLIINQSQQQYHPSDQGRHLRSSTLQYNERPSLLTESQWNEIIIMSQHIPDPWQEEEIKKYSDKNIWSNLELDLFQHNNKVILTIAYQDGYRALIKYNIRYSEGRFIAWDRNRVSRRLAIILQFMSDQIGGFNENEFNDNTNVIKFIKLYFEKIRLKVKSILN
jgi:hypothetical protein